jgi:hypothetical protein
MNAQMKVTDGQSFIGDAHVLLALQAIPQREGLLAFSALPNAPVTPARGPGRVRRVMRWSARHFGRPVQRAEESPRERPSLTASYFAVTHLAR